jgi:glycosyltransferase involved in cell wall biosynthesis
MLAELRASGIEASLIITDTQRIADWNRELSVYRREVTELIRSFGLEANVKFKSPTYLEMPALYSEADIVVYPTVGEEPYGLVPLEAMSCERPVVASRSGGIVETIIDGETGYTVERGDTSSFSERVRQLLNDHALAKSFGIAGRRRVVQHFAARRYVSTLIGRYKKG